MWDKEQGVCDSTTFRDAVKALDQNGSPQSWLITFSDESILAPAVTAPITELVSNLGHSYKRCQHVLVYFGIENATGKYESVPWKGSMMLTGSYS